MSSHQVKSICIAGGGSSGWLTAAHALHLFPSDIKVTLVESPNIPIIGVGEATLLGFDKFLTNECNIPFELWTKECDATIKLGTKFTNWFADGLDIWAPFLVPVILGEDEHHYDLLDLALKANITKPDFYSTCAAWWEISVEDKKIPSTATLGGPDSGAHGVAYNLDAIKLANFLSKWCNKKYPYLTHIKKHIDKPVIKNGNVDHLILEDGSTIHADVFIDCTGFKKLLSNAIEGSDWRDHSDMLYINSAVASQINYKDDEEPQHPYVDATAHDLGWIWKTPIKDRIGSGLCYNNTITTKQEAEDAFVQHWGKDRLRTGEFNHIKFTPEYNAKNWRGNVIPVGLSSGFVEPLESSGLGLMTLSMAPLASCLVHGEYTDTDRNAYNDVLAFTYQNTIDFIGLHYFNNPRTGAFWKLVAEKYDATESLFNSLKALKITATHTHQKQYYPRATGLFHEWNWKLWAYATGIGTKTWDMNEDEALKHINLIKDKDRKDSYPGIENRKWIHR
jgi:tryptophan halogenase